MPNLKVITRKQSKKAKPQESNKDAQVKRDPFENWKPKHRETARKSLLQYAEHLAEGAEALHTLEVALVKACNALPATYRMIIPI